ADHRGLSLYRLDVGVSGRVASAARRVRERDDGHCQSRSDQPRRTCAANENLATARWRYNRFRTRCPGLAGAARLRPRLRPRIASSLRSLAMAHPVECMAGLDPAIVDGDLVGFFIAVHTKWRDRTCLRSHPPRRP